MKTLKIIITTTDNSLINELNNYILGTICSFKLTEKDCLDIKKNNFNIEKIIQELGIELNFINQFDEVVFTGFEEGTYICGKLREIFLFPRVKFICLNPVNETIDLLRQTDYIVFGENDNFLSENSLNKLRYKYVNLSIIKNVNKHLKPINTNNEKKLINQIILEALTTIDSSSYME